ncbi:MAG TPA: undecaprenyl-diphosphate phosphatase [Candidatus Binatia bacterium]|nr:undecaprenyl-diphosphate phosphatase [Candidatus Binatia bacterium]
MHDWLVVLILGVIEGITEFLPVSSTGHLLIAEKILHSHQSDLFNIVIQCGAVVAVLPLFPKRISKFLFEWREWETQLYLLKILVAFGITGAGGLVIDHFNFKLPEELAPVAWALLIGGLAFLAVEFYLRKKPLGNQITWAIVFAVGIGQLVAAVFPGTSRSGTTILFSLILGLSRPAATEFSFLVGIPTMLAAGGWKIFKVAHHPVAGAMPENWNRLLFASVVAAIISFIAVKWLLRYVQTHTFNAFGWYRIAAAIIIFLFFLK